MYTEELLRQNPVLIKIFLGIPAEFFWQLVQQLKEQAPAYQQQRFGRAQRQREVGGGRPCDLPLAIRLALVLTYLRLHIAQEAVAALYADATQSDVSRQLRILLPALALVLPSPDVWEQIETTQPLSETELLAFMRLSDGRVIVDATEQAIYRTEVNDIRVVYYSGKKKQFTLKTQIVSDGNHHIVAISVAFPGSVSDKKLCDTLATVERLPDDCQAAADKGYQGVAQQVTALASVDLQTGEVTQTPRLTFHTPFKKPKGAELSEQQEAFNQTLATWRIRIEHCIGWAKNWKILATRFRAAHSLYTRVMQVVCGFVNAQTQRWQALSA
jgi:DDE superfamily endonuclease